MTMPFRAVFSRYQDTKRLTSLPVEFCAHSFSEAVQRAQACQQGMEFADPKAEFDIVELYQLHHGPDAANPRDVHYKDIFALHPIT